MLDPLPQKSRILSVARRNCETGGHESEKGMPNLVIAQFSEPHPGPLAR
jgi:hypothetical protein